MRPSTNASHRSYAHHTAIETIEVLKNVMKKKKKTTNDQPPFFF